PGEDGETAFPDQTGDRLRDLRRDPRPMDVPPRAPVSQESPLLRAAEAVPQRLRVRSQAIDSGAPADFSGAPLQPPTQTPQVTVGQLIELDGRRLEIGVRARDQAASR